MLLLNSLHEIIRDIPNIEKGELGQVFRDDGKCGPGGQEVIRNVEKLDVGQQVNER